VETDRKNWEGLVGTRNAVGEVLEEKSLKSWAKGPPEARLLQCQNCGRTGPLEDFQAETLSRLPGIFECPICKNSKEVTPYIPEWSDWG